MTQAEPQLLSLLQKAANPLKSVDFSINVKGVYAPPQQWKITDEANPNIFTYSIKLVEQQITKGKIQPRKLTQKQLRELEEKNKKGGKKEAKTEEKPPEEVDEAEEQRKRQEWEALSEEERFYRTQEDPYKAFSLLFQSHEISVTLDEAGINNIQTKIDQNQVQIILIRKPDMNQEDVGKMKKSKPKNLNIAELYEAKYVGKIDMKQLLVPGCKNIEKRVKVAFNGEMPEDGIQIDAQNCYVHLLIETSQALSPIVKQIKPKVKEILPEFSLPDKKLSASSIQKLNLQICRGIRAISQEYLQFFAKEKDHTTEQRKNLNLSNISTLRLNEINRKKDAFLTEFVNSGKFNILKDRIRKSVKAVIIDKFRKQKGKGNIDLEQINKILSELNVFFQEEFAKTIDQFMGDNTLVHEDLVLGYQNSKYGRKQIINPIIGQSQNERFIRLANEYQILHLSEKAEENYLNLLLLNNEGVEFKENYAKFCLKEKNFDAAYALYSEIASESQSLGHLLIEATLLINRKRNRDALILLTSIIEHPEAKISDKVFCNNLLSFMYEIQGNIKESEKYLAIAQRYFQMKENPNLKFKPVPNPYLEPRPKVPKPERYVSQLTHSQSQEIRLTLANFFCDLNLFNLVQLYLQKLEDSHKKSIFEIEVDIFQEKYDEAIQKINALLKKDDNIRNIDLLLMKADICYKADKMFESQEVFLSILRLKPPQNKSLQIYLKLGYTYIHRKSWQDAKIVFQKACEIKYNCSAAWLGLGIANLNLEKYQQAEQALNLTKIYNPLSSESEEYQARVDEHFATASNKSL